jgi:hypothetical protein
MKIFTIENETNNITIHTTIQEAEAVANSKTFRSESGLSKLAADWPAARLVDIWNSLPGAIPVKKFKDRQTAVGRIWKAIQGLGQAAPEAAAADEPPPAAEAASIPDPVHEASETTEPTAIILDTPEAASATPVAPQTPDVAPDEAPATKKTTSRKGATTAPKSLEAKAPRESSKTAQVVAMLQREEGTTLSEIMTSMGWQRHTVRGFIACALKKAGFNAESYKTDGGERTYRINQ